MQRRHILWLSLCLCLWLTQSIAIAQPPTIITVTAPEYLGELYEDTIIPAFEAEYPNIQVEFVYNDTSYLGSPLFQDENGETTFYDDVVEYVTSADVLYMNDFSLSPYAINTGFFLDLSPLVRADETLNEADFYPVSWQTFQWDGGMWALPYSMQPLVLVYDRAKFDEFDIAYPDQSWRLEDYVQAATAMHTYNEQGEVELSPLQALNPLYLMYSTVGSVFDTTTFPTQPDYSNPDLQSMLQVLVDYYASEEFADVRGYSFNEMPMSISYPYQLSTNSFGSDGNADWAISLLPDNTAGSRIEGFAISSGTAFPEAAYTFASFMTQNIDVFSYGSGGRPARRLLSLAELDDDNGFFVQLSFEPEVEAIMDDAYEVAIPANQLWFADVAYRAQSIVNDGDVSLEQFLQDQELEIIGYLEESQSYQSTQITVAAPTLPPDLSEGEIQLTFGLNIPRGSNDRETVWNAIIDDFVASHPTVGVIDLDYQIYGPDGLEEEIDCWYDGYGSSLSTRSEPPEDVLALNPLMSADPNFDPSRFMPGLLDAVQIADLRYGYPLTVQPIAIWINTDKFAQANLPIPEYGWTTNEFTNALIALAEIREDSSEPIVRNNMFSPIWLTMLIASYGGQPIDFNADPIGYNLTMPESINAIEQLAGFIDDGLIQYDSLVGNNNVFYGGPMDDQYIVIDIFGDTSFAILNGDIQSDDSPLQIVTYPSGAYMPVAYTAGIAQISSQTQYVQECYDWITTIAETPELFTGIPSRPDLFTDPDLTAQQGDGFVALAETLAGHLTAPNALIFPSVYGVSSANSQSAWLEPNFFYYALDNVMLNDADIEAEMMQAEENLGLFRECVAGIDQLPQDQVAELWHTDRDAGLAYTRQFTDCAVTLVPELREQYSFYYQDTD